MKRWITTVCYLLTLTTAVTAQDWTLDRFPTPIWAQPGEAITVPVNGPPGQSGTLELVGEAGAGTSSAPLLPLGEGRYSATVRPAQSGSYRLLLRVGGATQELGVVQSEAGNKVFTARETVITRQGPDSDFDRLTPLVPGAMVTVDASQGEWYRSKATGAWLDGASGTVAAGTVVKPRLSRIMVDGLANGDAQLSLSTGTVPQAEAVLHQNGPLTLTLADTEHMVFDITKASDVANFLGPITVRPQTAPLAAVVEIGLTQAGTGGYQLEPGTTPGDLVLRVRRPVPKDLSALTVTLDAGHGGPQDPGTVGHGGLPEKVLNLRVTEALARMLEARGATVVMTRTTDSDVAPEDKGASHELQARVDLSVARNAHLFLSLHHNARPDVEEGKVSHGTDIYWYQPVSEPLARALADPIAEAIGEPLRTSRYRSFAVIRQTFSPSVLIEFQYLSNPTLEMNVLDRPDYPEKAAAGVVKGLEAYLRSLP